MVVAAPTPFHDGNKNDMDGLDESKPPQEPASLTALGAIVDLNDTSGKSYSDLTGRFPNRSVTGNLYVLVLYSYDDNAILVEALKSRSDTDQLAAYERIIKRAYERIGWTTRHLKLLKNY